MRVNKVQEYLVQNFSRYFLPFQDHSNLIKITFKVERFGDSEVKSSLVGLWQFRVSSSIKIQFSERLLLHTFAIKG